MAEGKSLVLPHNSIFLFRIASSLPVDFSKLFAKADVNTITTLQRITAGRNSFIQHLAEDNSTALIVKNLQN